MAVSQVSKHQTTVCCLLTCSEQATKQCEKLRTFDVAEQRSIPNLPCVIGSLRTGSTVAAWYTASNCAVMPFGLGRLVEDHRRSTCSALSPTLSGTAVGADVSSGRVDHLGCSQLPALMMRMKTNSSRVRTPARPSRCTSPFSSTFTISGSVLPSS